MRKKDFVVPEVDYEKPPKKSMTVPDMAVSMAEIMRRFTIGMEPGVPEIPAIWAGTDEDLEALARMDFADQAAYAEELRNEREQALEHIRQERAKKEAEIKAKNAARKAEIEAILEARKRLGSVDLDNTLPIDSGHAVK
ncbi:MAG: hypothetical protein QXT77_07045 [Candidatus Methanomethylicaceae archaeon]